MTPQQWKRIARNLKTMYAELEQEAIRDGFAITSPEFTEVARKLRTGFLENEGFTDEEYEKTKAIIEEGKQKNVAVARGDVSRYLETL